MKWPLLTCFVWSCLASAGLAQTGGGVFKPIFDGKTLAGWSGDAQYWRVEDGSIVGETTVAHPLDRNLFLFWERGEVDDFELRLKFRISGTEHANSGIQIRSQLREDGHLVGYQADFNRGGNYVGTLYDEMKRGGLAERGQLVMIDPSGQRSMESFGDPTELLKGFHPDDWNDYTILAQGNRITLFINGVKMSELVDQDAQAMDRSGKLALQLHAGPPMKVEFKDIQLKRLPLQEGWKKVVFIAGNPSHGYFAHEHHAGCLLLAKGLNTARMEQGVPVITALYNNGWPKDVTALDNADTVVAYGDGAEHHFLNDRLEEFNELVKDRQVGLTCLHFAVETAAGPTGDRFLDWIGGYFELNWSVNPHWVANFETLPDHPITRGVEPFEVDDEWYYHMRFVPGMKGITPILTALPSRESLNREEGPRSNNPAVRAAVLERQEPQHMAWAYERPNNLGRGFGFTGGHWHINWQHDDFRKLVLNAILWTAQADVPEEGVITPTPTQEQMEQNQDFPRPDDFRFQSPKRTPPAAKK